MHFASLVRYGEKCYYQELGEREEKRFCELQYWHLICGIQRSHSQYFLSLQTDSEGQIKSYI